MKRKLVSSLLVALILTMTFVLSMADMTPLKHPPRDIVLMGMLCSLITAAPVLALVWLHTRLSNDRYLRENAMVLPAKEFLDQGTYYARFAGPFGDDGVWWIFEMREAEINIGTMPFLSVSCDYLRIVLGKQMMSSDLARSCSQSQGTYRDRLGDGCILVCTVNQFGDRAVDFHPVSDKVYTVVYRQ